MSGDLRAVADVNVLVSAARTPNGLCGRLLEAATEGRWRPVVSPLLFTELEEVLARPAFKDALGEETIDRFLADLREIAEWNEDPENPKVALPRDPDDEYLLALAQSAEADVLISGDRDLTDLDNPDVLIEKPAEFFERLK